MSEDLPEPQGICDFSGFKYPISQLVRNWDGAMVHRRFVDKRNPQDFVRGVRERESLRVSRPEPPDVFTNPGDVTADSL